MLAHPVGRRLHGALQGEVGKGEPHLGRLGVGERDGEVVELTEAFGEDGARVLAVGTVAVRQGREDDHGVAAIGHEEMEPVDGEVGSDQGRSTSRAPSMRTSHRRECSGEVFVRTRRPHDRRTAAGDAGVHPELRTNPIAGKDYIRNHPPRGDPNRDNSMAAPSRPWPAPVPSSVLR